jgi:gas vesicle protein GvpL/GvpF
MEAVISVANESCLCLHAVVDPSELEQIDDPALLLVRHEDLGCVVRVVLASEYAAAQPESSRDQLEWLAPRAIEHHDLLLRLMRLTSVVPLKFGSLCGTAVDVQEMLRDNCERFRQLVHHVRSREEWAVNLYVDRDRALRRLESSETALGEIDEIALTRPDGEAYLLRKKKQKLANELLAARFTALQRELCSQLEHCVVEIANLARPREVGMQFHELLLSVAVLIAKDQIPSIERQLALFESEYAEDHVVTELCGPWPPYSFIR